MTNGQDQIPSPAPSARPLPKGEVTLLTDAELGEDGAQHLLDVDAPGEAAEMAGGDAKLLGLKLGAERWIAEAAQGISRAFELDAMPGAGH